MTIRKRIPRSFFGASFLLTSALSGFLSVGAHAQTAYTPFDFKDPSLNARPDIRELIQNFPIDARGVELDTRAVELPDVRLRFFTPIADMLEQATTPVFGPADGPFVPPECAEHETFQISQIPPVNSADASCRATYQQTITPAFRNFQKSCRYVFAAERFVEDQTPGAVNTSTVSNLEGLISLAGEALSHVDFPENVVTPQLKQQMRVIVAKIRHEKLMNELRQRQAAYQRALNFVRNRPACFAGTPESLSSFSDSLGRLNSELEAAKVFLQRLDREGRLQATADRNHVTAQGRTRPNLPYPSLSDQERQLVSMVLGGIYWRMRGGGLIDEPQGTQTTRFYYTFLPMSVLGALNGADIGRQAGQGVYFRLFSSWSRWQDMGRTDDDRYHDLVFMTRRGRLQVFDAGTTLQQKGYDTRPLLAGGMQMGSCYFYGWDRLANQRIGADLPRPPYAGFLGGPTEWGELCTGAAISLGLSKTLLNGSR